MELVVVGINHKTAPVEVREKFSFSPSKISSANRLLKEKASLAENLILSTCNRVEIYAAAECYETSVKEIKEFLARFHNIDISGHDAHLYVHRGQDAVRHLFNVASGLDSMVMGEMEILGQIKKAYKDARASLATGKVLNRLFEKTFNTAKKVRTETFIGRGTVSVGSAAAVLAKKILGDLNGKGAMIIGAGTLAEQLMLYLHKNGISSIVVANRTLEKARSLTERFSATAIAFEDFKTKLVETDIVIASTGAPHVIIHKDDIIPLMPRRKERPLFIIDLAVPRDVDERINTIDNAYLYNIDDLKRIVDENIGLRRNELSNCSHIIDRASDVFMAWLAKEKIQYEPSPSIKGARAEEGRAG